MFVASFLRSQWLSFPLVGSGLRRVTAQYVFWMSRLRNISLMRSRALEVRAKMTSPLTGRSRRCTGCKNTAPGFWYFSLI